MRKIFVELEVDVDAVCKAAENDDYVDAITSELCLLGEDGIHTVSWQFADNYGLADKSIRELVSNYKVPVSDNRMSVVLYNAISVLMDETWDQYENKDEWFAMLQNELGVTADELEKDMGIKITADGSIEAVDVEVSEKKETSNETIKATTIYFTTKEGEDATQFDTQDTAELLELFTQLLDENNLELVSVDGIEMCELEELDIDDKIIEDVEMDDFSANDNRAWFGRDADLISRSALLKEIQEHFAGYSFLSDNCQEACDIINSFDTLEDGDLVNRGKLLNAVLDHFGCDLAYYGSDLQFFQEAIEFIPAVASNDVEYTVKQYFNGIHWDNSYTNNKAEAEEWKAYMEDKSSSVWDRVNEEALKQFIKQYNISDAEKIEITVEIIEERINSIDDVLSDAKRACDEVNKDVVSKNVPEIEIG